MKTPAKSGLNMGAQRYQERDRLSRGTGPESSQAHEMDPGLRKWANETIRERLEAVEKALPGLLRDIENYLESSQRQETNVSQV